MFLDLIGGAVLVAVFMFDVTSVVLALDVPSELKPVLASIAGLWLGAQAVLAAAGAFRIIPGQPVALIGVMAATPLVVTVLASLFSTRVRAALLALPMSLLISLDVARVIGVFFLLLALAGRLSGPFPISAGWGDIITGLAALPLIAMAARNTGSGAILAWNVFGLLDLVAAFTLAVLSFNGSAIQLIHAGVGADGVLSMPWVLIPTALVPFYVITHGIIFAKLRTGDVQRAAVAA